MTDHNRGSCFWCGRQVDKEDWEEIGNNRVWVCGSSECNRELRNEQRALGEEARQSAAEDDYERYW